MLEFGFQISCQLTIRGCIIDDNQCRQRLGQNTTNSRTKKYHKRLIAFHTRVSFVIQQVENAHLVRKVNLSSNISL